MEAIEQQGGADTARAGNITTSAEVWRYIFDAIDEPVFLHDAQCCVLLANRAYCHEAGVTEAQALGKPYWEVFPQGNGPLPGCKDAMDGKNHDCSQEEVRVGAKLYLSKSYAVRDEQGKLRHALHKLNDITERRQAKEVLRLSALKLRLLFESSPYAQMTVAPPSWKFTEANQATVQLFGASSVAQFTALGLWDVSPQRQPDGRPSREKAQEMVATAMRDGHLFFEWEHQRLDGQPFPADVLLTRIDVAEEVFLQATVRDISEYKRLENELKRDAHIDMLTGLNNRRYFFELAEQEMARAKRYGSPLTALMLDLDHFKLVNDTYGHQVGDMVLQKFSEVFVKTLRGIDILGRIGGEEFAVLMPETKSEQALEVAERLRLAIASAAVTLPHDDAVHFTVSIGAASLLTTDSKVDDLLKRADAVLYTAKSTGRNRVCWDATADPFPQLGN